MKPRAQLCTNLSKSALGLECLMASEMPFEQFSAPSSVGRPKICDAEALCLTRGNPTPHSHDCPPSQEGSSGHVLGLICRTCPQHRTQRPPNPFTSLWGACSKEKGHAAGAILIPRPLILRPSDGSPETCPHYVHYVTCPFWNIADCALVIESLKALCI